MNKKIDVYYWKDSKWLMAMSFGEHEPPTPDEIATEYARVYGRIMVACPPKSDLEICEEIFCDLNIDTHPYIIYPLPEGVHHTSMSVGDVVKIDGTYYIAANIGFKKLEPALAGKGA